VNHLGEQISALIDGELAGADLDRANAHLAACGRCRAEAAELRQLKRDLRALFDFSGDDGLTGRLLAMTGPDLPEAPVPSRRLPGEQYRGELPTYDARDKRSPRGRGRGPARSARVAGPARPAKRSRGRYVLWSVISLFVIGVGTAAFTMGGAGGSAAPGPKITPQLEMFSVEHAMISGDVPVPEPTEPTGGVTSP
jgi:anti-sigma factor RsiW